MKKITSLTLLIFLFGWQSGFASQDSKYISASDIKRGMEGYGLTVFQGNTIEKFAIKIIGVLRNTGAKSDMILARLKGGPLAKTGVIAGMSGSPVYINGKLIGAVAYAWGFSKETIAGITPIKEMLETFSFRRKNKKQKFKIGKPSKTTLNGKQITFNNQQGTFHSVATPLIFSGVKPAIFNELSQPLKKMGFLPVLGGNAGSEIGEQFNDKFKPGAAIGVQLVSGDMSITGIGTVTYTGPQGILAFGHPMMMRGHSSFPMTTAYIHTVMPSRNVSFKLGSAVKQIGVVNQDRHAAIAGTYGQKPDMIPMSIDFTLEGKKKRFDFKVIRDDLLFPKMFGAVMMNTLTGHSSKQGRVSFEIKYSFQIIEKDSNKIHIVNVKNSYTSFQASAAYMQSLKSILNNLNYAIFNRFKNVEIKDIKIEIKALHGIQGVEITDIIYDGNKVKPGQNVKLRVELTPYKGSPIWKTLSIKIPKNIKNGKIFFAVSNAMHEKFYDHLFAPLKYTPYSVKDIVKILNSNFDYSALTLWSEIYQQGLILKGHRYGNLPSSQFALLSGAKTQKIGILNGRLKKTYHTNYFIYGMKFVVLNVDYSPYNN